MCTLTKAVTPLVAETDIICYKSLRLVNGGMYSSIYMGFTYTLNDLYTSELSFGDNKCAWDNMEQFAWDEIDPTWQSDNSNVNAVEMGFHAVLNPERFENEEHEDEGGITMICVIPKGSKYFLGLTDIIVSDSIIVLGELYPTNNDEPDRFADRIV